MTRSDQQTVHHVGDVRQRLTACGLDAHAVPRKDRNEAWVTCRRCKRALAKQAKYAAPESRRHHRTRLEKARQRSGKAYAAAARFEGARVHLVAGVQQRSTFCGRLVFGVKSTTIDVFFATCEGCKAEHARRVAVEEAKAARRAERERRRRERLKLEKYRREGSHVRYRGGRGHNGRPTVAEREEQERKRLVRCSYPGCLGALLWSGKQAEEHRAEHVARGEIVEMAPAGHSASVKDAEGDRDVG